MMRFVDDFLNKITMYRLVFYELLCLLAVAGVLGLFHLVPYSPQYILYSAAVLFSVSWIVNKVFAYFFEAPSNPESTYITALILALIMAPPQMFGDVQYLVLAGWVAALAVASKYIFAINQKHIFNPAAFGVAVTALFLNQGATWWVGTLWMLPFVAIGGFLIARKIRRLDMVVAFGVAIVAAIIFLNAGQGGSLNIIEESLLYAPAVFLGTVMLTEPMTTPPSRFLRIGYAILVGCLFVPEAHIGSFYFTPELALLAGNIFVYVVSPKTKLRMSLVDRIRLSPDTYEFVFHSDRKLKFKPGQYLEWTLAHTGSDSRGIRRFFTIASAPDDSNYRIGVKFYQQASSFKRKLFSMKKGDSIVASQLAGDFVLPQDKKKKLVFIAGGIGITPFRSMLEDLLTKKERRDIIVLYSNRTIKDVAYVELLDRAERELGIETLPIVSEQTPDMLAKHDFPTAIDQHLILTQIPDYEDRIFYISGPRGMITAFSDLLQQLGVPWHRIKKDFFPGFA